MCDPQYECFKGKYVLVENVGVKEFFGELDNKTFAADLHAEGIGMELIPPPPGGTRWKQIMEFKGIPTCNEFESGKEFQIDCADGCCSQGIFTIYPEEKKMTEERGWWDNRVLIVRKYCGDTVENVYTAESGTTATSVYKRC